MLERQFAQLAEQPFHFEDADAHEHLDEGAGVDENERLADLAGDGLCYERLAGAGRAPQEDSARDVATLCLDLVGVLQEGDVLLDQVEHVVLAPHRIEAGLDVLGKDDIDPTLAEEPEHQDELPHHHAHDHHEIDDDEGVLADQAGDGDQAVDRVGDPVDNDHHPGADDHEKQEDLEQPGQAEAGPLGHHPLKPPLDTAEHAVRPHVVVAGRPLRDVVVELTEDFETHQHDEGEADNRSECDLQRLAPAGKRRAELIGHREEEEHPKDEQDLESVEDRGRVAPVFLHLHTFINGASSHASLLDGRCL